MTESLPPPTRDAFLTADPALVAAVAPTTAVFALGGTRRRAALAGVASDTEQYITEGRVQMARQLAVFFRYGIRHLIVPCLGPRTVAEAGRYSAKIIEWSITSLAGAEMISAYQQQGWAARFLVPSPQPQLEAAAAQLRRATPTGAHTIWYYFVLDDADPWREVFAAIRQTDAATLAAAQQVLYGEVIAPAELYIGFGKLVTGTTLVPPLLLAPNIQCYWYQRAGLELSDTMLRHILYDYGYARRNWTPDRAGRYTQAPRHAARWDTESVIGVGSQQDGFWFPDPFPAVGPIQPE